MGCSIWNWTRDRRVPTQALMQLILTVIQKLFWIEREAKSEGLGGEALVERRPEVALPILEVIEDLIKAKRLVEIWYD